MHLGRIGQRIGWNHLRWGIAILLFAAAVLKAFTSVEILNSSGLLSSPLLLYSAIAFETMFAVFLVFGNRDWSRRLTIVTFSCFALASGYALATGTSCNCFGGSLDPGWMFAIDLLVLAVTIRCRSGSSSDKYDRRRVLPAIAGILLAGLLVGVAARE